MMAVMMIIVLAGCNKTVQEKYQDNLVSVPITVQANEDTRIRKNCWVSDKNDPSNIICEAEALEICAESHYEFESPFNGIWYGFCTEDVPEDAPAELIRWCEKHPGEIFWMSTAGGLHIIG